MNPRVQTEIRWLQLRAQVLKIQREAIEAVMAEGIPPAPARLRGMSLNQGL
jgi:hypothetical protein